MAEETIQLTPERLTVMNAQNVGAIKKAGADATLIAEMAYENGVMLKRTLIDPSTRVKIQESAAS